MKSLNTEVQALKDKNQHLQSALDDNKTQTKNALKVIETSTSQQVKDLEKNQADITSKLRRQADQLSSFRDHQAKPSANKDKKTPTQPPHQTPSNLPTPLDSTTQLVRRAPLLPDPPLTNDKPTADPKTTTTATYASVLKTPGPSQHPVTPPETQHQKTTILYQRITKIPQDCHTLILSDSIFSNISEPKLSDALQTHVHVIAIPASHSAISNTPSLPLQPSLKSGVSSSTWASMTVPTAPSPPQPGDNSSPKSGRSSPTPQSRALPLFPHVDVTPSPNPPQHPP